MRSVLQMSLAATPLICGITLARTLLRRRISPRVFLLLWSLAVCRLLAPLWVPVRKAAVKPLLNHVYGGIFNVTRQAVALLDDRFLFFAWLLGAFVVLGYALTRHYSRRVEWREAVPMQQETVLAWQYRQTGRRFITVLQSDRTRDPFSRGVLHPTIVFPSPMAEASEDTLLPILAHEEAHLRGFHPLMRYLLLAVRCIHWFNPFVWLMAALCERDMELAADETAMRGQSRAARVRYAKILDELDQKPMGLDITVHLGEPSLIERMQRLKWPKKQSKVGTGILILVLGLLFGLLIMVPSAALERDVLDNHHLYYGEDLAAYSQRINAKGYVLSDKGYQ